MGYLIEQLTIEPQFPHTHPDICHFGHCTVALPPFAMRSTWQGKIPKAPTASGSASNR